MTLPYTIEVFFASMAEYNRTWFPLPPVAVALGLLVIFLAVRPPARWPEANARVIGTLLAAGWLWVGWAHQLQLMATLDFMAPVYGWAWIVQGVLLAATCALLGRVGFRFAGDSRGWAGLAIALYGLLGYPLAVLALGHDWRGLPLAGVAPAPTAILTAGLLAAARPSPPLHLFIVPAGWTGVAALSAYWLAFPLDYTVAAAIVVAIVVAVLASWHPPASVER